MGFLSFHPTGQAVWEGDISRKFKGMGQGLRGEEKGVGARELSGRSEYRGDLVLEGREREK